jgi:hypothetical protein
MLIGVIFLVACCIVLWRERRRQYLELETKVQEINRWR